MHLLVGTIISFLLAIPLVGQAEAQCLGQVGFCSASVGGGAGPGSPTFTATGPSSGSEGSPSTNFTVTISSGFSFTGSQTITIGDGSQGGTITPSVGSPGTSTVTVTPAAYAHVFTFTYTPATTGAITLTFANAQSWTDPSPLTYTSSGATLTLDGITTGLVAAYSTRQLLTAYAGNALQVERNSDSTTSNIGFVANVLDTTTLTTFCSGTTCFVSKWYDQSGNGYDLTNACGSTYGAIIYTSGALITINSNPAVVGLLTDCMSNASLSGNPVNTRYTNFVMYVTSDSNTPSFCCANGAATFLERINTDATVQLLSESVALIGGSSSSITLSSPTDVEASYNSASGAWAIWINSSAAGSGTQAETLTPSTFYFANGFIPVAATNYIGEAIIYDQVLTNGISGPAKSQIETSQASYWGT